MKYIKRIKDIARSEAVNRGIDPNSRYNPIRSTKGRQVYKAQSSNPIRNIERYAVKKYKKLNWHEKTNINLQNKKYEL